MILALALVTVAACDVDNDAKNDQVTLEYNGQEIEKTARDAARAAEGVATSVGNVAVDTGRAIGNEVGDIDVDVDVSRNKADDGK
jgi:hypothetical protein